MLLRLGVDRRRGRLLLSSAVLSVPATARVIEMTRLLRQCGKALYGDRWQRELAIALGVADRTVRRWIAGDNSIPAGVYGDLQQIIRQRITTLQSLQQAMETTDEPNH